MLPNRLLTTVALSLLAASAGLSVSAAPSPLALSCQGCHQPAVDAGTMPALSKHSPAEIAASLHAARDQPVAGSIMARFAQHLSDAEIDALATELGKPAPARARH